MDPEALRPRSDAKGAMGGAQAGHESVMISVAGRTVQLLSSVAPAKFHRSFKKLQLMRLLCTMDQVTATQGLFAVPSRQHEHMEHNSRASFSCRSVGNIGSHYTCRRPLTCGVASMCGDGRLVRLSSAHPKLSCTGNSRESVMLLITTCHRQQPVLANTVLLL